jgi:hypothetical protein
MSVKKRIVEGELYCVPRFWYHISTTLNRKEILLKPRDNDSGFNRSYYEPNTERICVTPSLEQCIVAVPYYYDTIFSVYKTKYKEIAERPIDIFDSKITQEGWLIKPTIFTKIGKLNIDQIISFYGKENKDFHMFEDAATAGILTYSKEAYRWWTKHNPWQFVK